MIQLIIALIIFILIVFIFVPDVILIFGLFWILIFVIYFTVAEVYFLFTTIIFLLYFGLKYNDGDEYTGSRAWKGLRKYTFNISINYHTVDKDGYVENERLLFVVLGNITNFSLISGFGLHGGKFGNVDLNYILPSILFKVPILRDILLWTGAVTFTGNDKEGTVIDLLKRNKSVAYAPSGMDDLLKYTGSEQDVFSLQNPDVGLFEFAIKHKIKIVPVLIQGETERYSIRKNKYIHKIQRYCMTKWKWPFPFWFFVKIWNKEPPPKVNMYMGPIMNSEVYPNASALSESFLKKCQEQYTKFINKV